MEGGLLIPVPQDWLSRELVAKSIQALQTEVNQARAQLALADSRCDLWFADVCTLNPQPHFDLILQLYDVGCILFGEFV